MMRSEFEKWCLENEHDQYALGFEDAYMAGCLSQQSKVDELQKKLDEYIFVAESIDEMYEREVKKNNELQKRVDALLNNWSEALKEPYLAKDARESLSLCVDELEQSLKGESND